MGIKKITTCDKCKEIIKDDELYYKISILNSDSHIDLICTPNNKNCKNLDICQKCEVPIFNYMTKK